MKNKYGVYKARLVYEGYTAKKMSTFFLAEWSREKVIDKIVEAYKNFVKSGNKAKLCDNGTLKIICSTVEGIEIEIIMTIKGRIITAYPLLS